MLYRSLAQRFSSVASQMPFSFRTHTTVGIGGEAPLAFFPEHTEECVRIVRFLQSEEVAYCVLGRGSNVLVSDSGFDGVVLCTSGMKDIRCGRDAVYAECGAGGGRDGAEVRSSEWRPKTVWAGSAFSAGSLPPSAVLCT